MKHLLELREAIYNQFHGSSAGPDFFFKGENSDRYAAYYTSMYLLQDSGEALWLHRQRSFSKQPLQAYLEFWGVMQAIIIMQDAIGELYYAVIGIKLNIGKDSAWNKLRDLRNMSAGHPAKRDRNAPFTRTFMGRNFGDYPSVTMEVWDFKAETRSHPRYDLAAMMDAYETEAVGHLQRILDRMQQKWPMTS